MPATYEMKKGSRTGLKADLVVRELEKLSKRHGELRPADVVRAASSPAHPFHNYFEWDDTIAAAKFRIVQAQKLLRVVILVQETDGEESVPIRVRAYQNIQDDDSQYYCSTVKAMSDDHLRQKVLAQALREMNTFKEKYRDLKELAKVFEALEEVEV